VNRRQRAACAAAAIALASAGYWLYLEMRTRAFERQIKTYNIPGYGELNTFLTPGDLVRMLACENPTMRLSILDSEGGMVVDTSPEHIDDLAPSLDGMQVPRR
jgi:hypothetical protein